MALSRWIMAAQNSGLEKFINCGNTLVRWSKGILNSFGCPYTNGFTEGVNNKIKVLKRNAFGYRSFQRFRNRILHMFCYPIQKGGCLPLHFGPTNGI
jgi:transposase